MTTFIKKLALFVTLVATHFAVFAQVPSDSPYKTDPQFVYNKDDSSDAFRIVEVVSCYVRSMAPEIAYNQVGPNPYVAMVDTNKCENNTVESSSGGSVKVQTNYETAVVLPSLDNSGGLNFRIWLNSSYDENGDGEPDKLWVTGKVVGSASKVPPFGQWEVFWCGTFDPATGACAESGYVSVSPDGMRGFFTNRNAVEQWLEESSVVGLVSPDKSAGGGRFSARQVDLSNGNSRVSTGVYAFNANLAYSLITSDGGASSNLCTIPDSSNPGALKSPWETWLYDSITGERVNVNSGFSIRDANGQWGYAGYWGADIRGTPLASGQVVTRIGSNDEVLGTYTGFSAPGKLRKTSISDSSLSEIEGLEMRVWAPKSILPGFSSSDDWVAVITKWNGTAFEINGWESCSSGECSIEEPQSATSFTLDQISDENGLQVKDLHAWQNGTGTSYRLIFAKWIQNQSDGQWSRVRYTTPDTVIVKARKDTPVNPGSTDVPGTLFCVGRCADVNLNYRQTGDEKKAVVDNRPYTWSQSSLTLSLGSTPIDFTGQQESYSSGTLVDGPSLASLACRVWDQDSQSEVDGYCDWLADDNLEEFYRWESGPNRWDRFSGIKDESGNVVTFEEPMFVSYSVPADDPSQAYRGKTVTIQYPGDGDFWLPGYCFNETNFARVQCSNNTGWATEFTIPYNESIGYVTSEDGTRYLVKTLRQGVYYAPAQDQSSQECQSLRTQGQTFANRTLPSLSDWVNPADPSSSAYIGAWRTPSSAPLIIDGKLQTAN